MRNVFIPFSFVFIGLGLSILAQAQDEIIANDDDVPQECNVETSEKCVSYNT